MKSYDDDALDYLISQNERIKDLNEVLQRT